MSEFISKDDLHALRQLKLQENNAMLASESAVHKSRVAELNYENAVLRVYIRHGITLDGGLDIKDGRIIRDAEKEKEKRNGEQEQI